MERELDFPRIDGRYYGGDQNWYRRWLMRLGGCSTTTACEACICLARQRSDMRVLYPGNAAEISMKDFLNFADTMFDYVHPGIGGLTDPGRYAVMLSGYAASCGADVTVDILSGEAAPEQAEAFIRSAVESGRPVAYLMLRHRDPTLEDFVWHWFSVTGYRETPCGFDILAANLGQRHILPLRSLWQSGFAWKGGLASLRAADGARRSGRLRSQTSGSLCRSEGSRTSAAARRREA